MAKDFNGKTYNTDWEPIDATGNVTGPKDWEANAANAAATGGQNPYTNQPGPSPFDRSGLIPENEPNSTIPKGTGTGVNPRTGGGVPPAAPETPFAWDNPGDFSSVPAGTGGIRPPRGGQQAVDESGMPMQTPVPAGTGGIRPPRGGQQAVNPDGTPMGVQGPGAGAQASGGALSVTAPTMDAAALMSQLQGPAALGQVAGPANLSQVQGPAALGQVQGPQALGQLGAAPTVAQAGPTSQFGQSVQSSIQQGLADPTVDPNSPAYQAQVAAFQRNAQRSAERTRASNAQRANAQGTLGSGGFDASVNRVLQNQGADEADFESQLQQRELNAGRDRQARSQQLGTGLLSQEQQQGLTERLANQSGALTGMGLDNQRDLSNQSTAMQALGLNTTRDLSNQSTAMQALGLNSARDLSNQSAGLQMAGLNSGRDQSNQQAMMNLLGLNNQRDLTSYGAQNQRDLTNYGGQLQAGLANQGAQMTQRGYNLQKYLGGRDLDLRGQQIGNQDAQYYSGLGQQLGLSTAQLNQDAMLALLRGGG